ncbi:MAG: alpha/beta hydrolase-fold protein, partial [Verrucomicrobiales bacterium]
TIRVALPGDRVFLPHDDLLPKVVSLAGRGGAGEVVWEERSIRNSYNVPVLVGGKLYAYSSRAFGCVDSETGELLWRSADPGDGFLSAVDGHLVMLTKRGTLHLAEASTDDYRELASVELFADPSWCVPAVVGNSIFVRSNGEIARVDIVPGESVPLLAQEEMPLGADFAAFLEAAAAAPNRQAFVERYLAGQKEFPIIEGDIVHFVLSGDHHNAAVASDLFGARQERTMVRLADTDFFYYSARIPTDTRAGYIFVTDFSASGPDPRNQRRVKSNYLVEDMEMVFLTNGETLVFSYFDMPDHVPTFDPTGEEELRGAMVEGELESEAMGETIAYRIYTPPGYSEEGAAFPVVFVHDAEAAQDYGHLPRIVDELIATRAIRPVVVAFIRRAYNPMVGAMGYEQMFSEELIARIERDFNLSSDREDRASLGGGFGGFLSLTGGLSASAQIGKIGAHSPYAFAMMLPMVSGAMEAADPKPSVRLDYGTFDLANPDENWDMGAGTVRIGNLLEDGGIPAVVVSFNDGTDWLSWR